MGPSMSGGAALIHPTALVETGEVGAGTSIWAFCHVMAGAVIGRDCNVGDHCYIEGGARVGDGVTIKNGCMLWEGVTIEDEAFVGPGVVFTNDLRPRSPRAAHARSRYAGDGWLARTVVREGASIGAGAVILPGLSIGRHALVAAGAVVTRGVPDHGLVTGNPARLAGWACRCGATLAVDDGRAGCAACGAAYEIVADALREAID
jgi:UDP-2-acetamido-3-amino-2,3-dideoxy-glucuronate N-acetyltransferase